MKNQEERRLKYAMVGGGKGSFIGPIHRMAIRMDDLADLVDGCYSHSDDWRALIDRCRGKVDFLAVCTPNDSHYAIAKAALDSGFPMVKLARDLVAAGELGKIDKIVLEYQQGSFRKIDFSKPLDKRNAWKMNPKKSGPSCVVADIGVHGFYLIEHVTGLKINSVLADLSSFAPGNRLDDDASILLRLSGGAKASFVVSKIATGEENGVRLRVYGDKASLFWNQEENNYLSVKYPFGPEKTFKRNAPYVAALSEACTRLSRIPAGHHEGFIEAFANIYREFCAAVRDRKAHDFPGPRAGVRTMRFVEAALRSNRNGNRWEKV